MSTRLSDYPLLRSLAALLTYDDDPLVVASCIECRSGLNSLGSCINPTCRLGAAILAFEAAKGGAIWH